MTEAKITLGYWAGPGKVQPSRYLLELSGLEYNDVQYTDGAHWFGRDKLALGLNFPNLPYVLDGDVKLTESETVFDYLIERTGQTALLGKGNDRFLVDNLRNLISDLGTHLYYYTLKEGDEKTKLLNDTIVPKFSQIKNFLGKKEFLVGTFSAADLYFLAVGTGFKVRIPDAYAQFADAFDPLLKNISEVPKLAAYLASGRHPKYQ